MDDIAIAILAVIIFLSGYGLGYMTGGLKKKNSMRDNNFLNMTEEERTLAWMYMIFSGDMIRAKTEQWTKEAEKAGMTLTEYLEAINPLAEGEKDKNETEMKDQERFIAEPNESRNCPLSQDENIGYYNIQAILDRLSEKEV